MLVYISQVKEVCDALTTCGCLISKYEQIATNLNGLSVEYRPFVVVITASREPFTLDEIVSILVDVEAQQQTFDRADSISASVARDSLDDSNHPSYEERNSKFARLNSTRQQYSQGGGSRVRSKLQCQLCGKIGYLVDRCWYRFDETFPGVSTSGSKASSATHSPSMNMSVFTMTGVRHSCCCSGHSSFTISRTSLVAKAVGVDYNGTCKGIVGSGKALPISKIETTGYSSSSILIGALFVMRGLGCCCRRDLNMVAFMSLIQVC
ncbi:hypothetical protein F3Y22_tig00116996pilonHSYRG00578 [Hibiscus syriacus]|uniref:Uncharacterized protein n=1 Tax=Hibiscus syriacus TaxID=106335 RepID=A0A6A2XFZ3_HIBSY|nr:hypothetical protein F3Y22_tig00116996pilonHSYRG00578 [Hibiscus syriacus]